MQARDGVGRIDLVPPEYPSDRVERELRQRITAGEWSPGERIPAVGTLAREHDTSRTTVSKAVQRLVDDGWLVVLPNYGTFVSDASGSAGSPGSA